LQTDLFNNPLSPPCIPPNPGFRDLSAKSKFLAVVFADFFASAFLKVTIKLRSHRIPTFGECGIYDLIPT
jgi:hypothetical protein